MLLCTTGTHAQYDFLMISQDVLGHSKLTATLDISTSTSTSEMSLSELVSHFF